MHADWAPLLLSALVGWLISLPLTEVWHRLVPSQELAELKKPELLDKAISEARDKQDWNALGSLLERARGLPQIQDNYDYSMGLLVMAREHPADPTPYFQAISPASPYFIPGQKSLTYFYRQKYSNDPSSAKIKLAEVAKFIRDKGVTSAFASFTHLMSLDPARFSEIQQSYEDLQESFADAYDFEADRLKPFAVNTVAGGRPPDQIFQLGNMADLVAAIFAYRSALLFAAHDEGLHDQTQIYRDALDRTFAAYPEVCIHDVFSWMQYVPLLEHIQTSYIQITGTQPKWAAGNECLKMSEVINVLPKQK
ncbi:MAG TPA: hypothetical protein VKM54_25130 [Myxococcota bacterium]|nr:hypothetical protein [Myxococcota bacterium]